MRRQYPDRSKLESQCVCVIAFVKNEQDLLDCPIWVMIINIVAMDMLKSKFPPGEHTEEGGYVNVGKRVKSMRLCELEGYGKEAEE